MTKVKPGATRWKNIRKLRVGAALGSGNHGDIHNIAGLVNQAFENACEVVAFARDIDAEPERKDAVSRGIAFAQTTFPKMAIIGGAAIPTIEGWILALLGIRDTESMSRDRANSELANRNLGGKHAEDYVAVIEKANLAMLPSGSLRVWIDTARAALPTAIHGTSTRA